MRSPVQRNHHPAVSAQSFRFALVGIMGSVLNLLVMTLLVEGLRSPAIVASAIATELAIIHNFLLHRCWTFAASEQGHPFFVTLVRYNLAALATGGINLIIVAVMTQLGCWYLSAQALGIVVAWLANYHLASHFIFAKAHQHATS